MVAAEAESDGVPVTTNPCPRFFFTLSSDWLFPRFSPLARARTLFPLCGSAVFFLT